MQTVIEFIFSVASLKIFLFMVYILYWVRTFKMLLEKESHGVMSFVWLFSTFFVVYIVIKIEQIKEGIKLLMPGIVFLQHQDAEEYFKIVIYMVIAAVVCNFSRAICVVRELDKGVFMGVSSWDTMLQGSGVFTRRSEKLLRSMSVVFFTLFVAALTKLAHIDVAFADGIISYNYGLDRVAMERFTQYTDNLSMQYRSAIVPISVWGMLFYIVNFAWSLLVYYKIFDKNYRMENKFFRRKQAAIILAGFFSLYTLIEFAGGVTLGFMFMENFFNNVMEKGGLALISGFDKMPSLSNIPFKLIVLSLVLSFFCFCSIVVCSLEGVNVVYGFDRVRVCCDKMRYLCYVTFKFKKTQSR